MESSTTTAFLDSAAELADVDGELSTRAETEAELFCTLLSILLEPDADDAPKPGFDLEGSKDSAFLTEIELVDDGSFSP